jgi:hypothetical protein
VPLGALQYIRRIGCTKLTKAPVAQGGFVRKKGISTLFVFYRWASKGSTKLGRRYVRRPLYHWLQKYVPLLKHISERFEAFAY